MEAMIADTYIPSHITISKVLYQTWELIMGQDSPAAQFWLCLFVTTILICLPHTFYVMNGVFEPDNVRITKERIKRKVFVFCFWHSFK